MAGWTASTSREPAPEKLTSCSCCCCFHAWILLFVSSSALRWASFADMGAAGAALKGSGDVVGFNHVGEDEDENDCHHVHDKARQNSRRAKTRQYKPSRDETREWEQEQGGERGGGEGGEEHNQARRQRKCRDKEGVINWRN